MNAYYYTRVNDRRKRRFGRWASDVVAAKTARGWTKFGGELDKLYRREGELFIEIPWARR